MLTVHAIQCPECLNLIFSRARHDFRTCECGSTSVDGGFDYQKVSFKSVPPKPVKVKVKATKKQLFDDWNQKKDKYGLIRLP